MGVPALFAFGTWIVGDGLLAARLLALLAVAGTAALLWVFLDRYTRLRPAGVLAGLFYLAYMSRPEGLAANTEVFNNLAVTAASFLLAGQMVSPSPCSAARPVVRRLVAVRGRTATEICGVPRGRRAVRRRAAMGTRDRSDDLAHRRLAGDRHRRRAAADHRRDAVFLVGRRVAALSGRDVCARNVAYLAEPLMLGTVLARLRYGLLPISGLLAWPFVLLVLERRQRLSPATRMICLWLAIWLVAACVDVVLPLKFWKHYFNALVPPLCLMAGLALTLLARILPALALPALALQARTLPAVASPGRTSRMRLAWTIAGGMVLTLIPAAGEMVLHAGDSRTINRVNVPSEIVTASRRAAPTPATSTCSTMIRWFTHTHSRRRRPDSYSVSNCPTSRPARAPRRKPRSARILATNPRWIVVAQPSPYNFSATVWRELEGALRDYKLDATFLEADYIQPPIEVSLFRRREARQGE